MAKKIWLDSDALVRDVKRNIAVPIAQEAYSDDDILEFANDELYSTQVPSIMEYHEEFFVNRKTVALEEDVTRYPIPDRAIGMKLRDLFFQDDNENLIPMVRINPDDQDIYLNNNGNGISNNYTYFIEGNDVVLTCSDLPTPTGSLVFTFFLRPNKLVLNESAAVVEAFMKEITVDNSALVAGDTVSINGVAFVARASGAGAQEFNIGASSILTATNLAASITTEASASASNGVPATAVVTVTYYNRDWEFVASNSASLIVSDELILKCEDDIPSGIAVGDQVDFLQTKPGHKTYSYDVEVPTGAIDEDKIAFDDADVPDDFIVGDYLCRQYECIIPQIPPDLHPLLVDRTCARILAAQGDMEMLQQVNQGIDKLEKRQGDIIDNRVVGSPMKVINRNSTLRSGKFLYRKW